MHVFLFSLPTLVSISSPIFTPHTTHSHVSSPSTPTSLPHPHSRLLTTHTYVSSPPTLPHPYPYIFSTHTHVSSPPKPTSPHLHPHLPTHTHISSPPTPTSPPHLHPTLWPTYTTLLPAHNQLIPHPHLGYHSPLSQRLAGKR
ncbi:hypothetical protein Pcinc_043990 [Petrolisthes cinctipes]|uniref:Uncharacterized protein n=1 Tax=Petrolisthes cinctipes TaxID=88211 RepID=A0AAE1BEW7_PETCI|nr:hypothetical protein Pcinc_043990 [Petrolisthes cinctipes]